LILASAEHAGALGLRPLGRIAVAARVLTAIEGASRVEADVTAPLADQVVRAAAAAGARLNPRATALPGHAAGADGARLVVTLIHALRRAGGGRGLAVASDAWGATAGLLVEVGP